MNYNYLTTIARSIFTQMYKFLIEKYIFTTFAYEGQNKKNVNNTRNTYIWFKILLNLVVR